MTIAHMVFAAKFCNRVKFINKQLFSILYRKIYSEKNSFTSRSHTCGELQNRHDGQEVTLCGWISFQRFNKFVIIKDRYGSVQIMFDEYDIINKNFTFSLPLESVIQVKGIAKKRPEYKINKKMETGEIEVLAQEIKLLNSSIPGLPLTAKDYEKARDVTKLKYRYLSLRIPRTQEILKTRSQFIMKIRDFLHNHHSFIEIETPSLFLRTPGGAKEFIVPTKFPGQCYSLVQSPQQFKQLLMVGGLDRYFQIARCYRNEGMKTDRQPEFTQVDIEVSFTTAEDIRNLVEQMLYHSWPTPNDVKIPFPVMTYADSMRLYGTDKPDIRYGIEIQDLTDLLLNQNIEIFNKATRDGNTVINAITLPLGSKHIKKAHLKVYKDKAEEFALPNVIDIGIKTDLKWNSFLSKHVPEEVQHQVNEKMKVNPNDMILIVAGQNKNIKEFLGKIRNEAAEHLQSCGADVYDPNKLALTWIVDFPLFLKNEKGDLESAHHPFTAPRLEDTDLVYTNPADAHSLHYDLVLNGQEIAGGSIRIHDSAFQNYILEEILKEDTSNLQHLLEALSSGCPPHGGIALGVDRLIAIMFRCRSISEVIAFPKSQDGKDLMSGAPAPMSEEDQRLYHIAPIFPKT